MMGLSGFELNNLEKVQLLKPSIGGVILFTRNFKDIHQVKALIAAIRSLKSDLLIGVDHEGGRVQRFRKGFTSAGYVEIWLGLPRKFSNGY